MEITNKRVRFLNDKPVGNGPVLYWMNRDQRVVDNWALIEAQQAAKALRQPLVIVFCLLKEFLTAKNQSSDPHFNRMRQGLKIVQADAASLGIAFYILEGSADQVLPSFVKTLGAAAVYADFSPLREMRLTRQTLAAKLPVRLVEVDAHNICPAFYISEKQEWGAYTLRPKINRALPEFLIDFPKVSKELYSIALEVKNANAWLGTEPITLNPKRAVQEFIKGRLAFYEKRNDPNQQATSRLSDYLHYGNISAQRLALDVQRSGLPSESFLEELIVRRELADNFCLYQPYYDDFKGFPAWAQKTLNEHRKDPREYVYRYDQFAEAKTHDEAWNAAQTQMVKTGYMHGYMRMYWAKKILEWTATPEEALTIANRLNNVYELDGRDPNGYVGTAWAIGGVHDRPWQERKIFGMIRYMNAQGLQRKFDLGLYIRTWLGTGLGI